MTHAERAVLEAATSRPLHWTPDPSPAHVRLTAQPCPLLDMDQGLASCSVWEARPYNCRRFGCYRPDPKTEPYEPDHTIFGCANLSERMPFRIVRRDYTKMQRKAQRWARKHGWTEQMT